VARRLLRPERWRWPPALVLAVAGLILAMAPSDAANTSRRTGKGAVRDESVYCQNWPGHSSRPEYHGTGPQTPFGADCTRSPAEQQPPPPPPPPPPPEEVTACAARGAAVDAPRIVLASNGVAPDGPGLWVGGSRITQGRDFESRWALTAKHRMILEAMICNASRVFQFADENELFWTIALRAEILDLLERMRNGATGYRFANDGRIRLPGGVEFYPEPQASMTVRLARREPVFEGRAAARSARDRPASAIITAARSEGASVDCLAGMELVVLDAAEKALGSARFDTFHAPRVWPHLAELDADDATRRYALVGIGVPLTTEHIDGGTYRIEDNRGRTSVAKHLVLVRYHVTGGARGDQSLDRPDDALAGPIAADDMVPGDYAYLSNLPNYESWHRGGGWNGENAFYVGHGEGGRPAFYGFGLRGVETETKLRGELADAYNEGSPRTNPARPEEMQWTRLGAPTLYGDPHHAGMFRR
jgi:hypothetical protein